MKKKLLAILSIVTLASFALGANEDEGWDLTFGAGTFFDSSGVVIQEDYKFALIVDMENNGFGDDFKLTEGNSFVRGSYVDSSNSEYMTLATGSLKDADGAGYYLAYSDSSFKFNNEIYGFKGGEKVALVVWNTKSEILEKDDMYTVINPAYTDTSSSGNSVNWVIAAENSGRFQWELSNKSIGGDTSDEFFTLSKVVQAGGVVPEPSSYASLMGIGALVFAFVRRRK